MLKVGLDIGAHSIKCAVVEAKEGRIQDFWQAELFPERSSRNHKLEGEARRKKLLELLRQCKEECKGFKQRVVTAVQGSETGAGYLELPSLSKQEIDTAVTSHVIQQIPFPIEDVALSHISVPPVDRTRKRKGFFFVAAHRSLVEGLKKSLEECDVEAARVEVPALALVREFSKNHKLPDGEFAVLVHVGFQFTHLVILRDGYPYWAREFSRAGRDFTYGVQVARELTWKQAEKEKRNNRSGIAELEIEPQLGKWAGEIKRTLDYFATRFSEKPLTFSSLFLSGGSCRLKGLERYLSERVKIPVHLDRWDQIHPVRENDEGSESSAVHFKIAVGLALGQ